ncbi:MAG: 16S rRNA (guanine(527)-N(7))-methyltransferase RsmG [Desulfatiglandales bacterium]
MTNKDHLRILFERSGLRLTPEQIQLFWRFHSLLREKSRESDLTRIYNFENMVIKHYVDCAIVPSLVELPSELLDLGTGAGFPGIPIKIMRPQIRLTLVETRQDRIRFLEEVLEELELKDVILIKKKLSGPIGKRFEGVITRALEDITSTLRRVFEVLEPNGKVIFMKGPNCDEEIEEAKENMGAFYPLYKDIHYTIPETTYKRRLLVYRKNEVPFRDLKEITSSDNKTYKLFKSLLTSKGIEKSSLFLMWGSKVVKETIQDHITHIEGLILRQGGPFPESILIDSPYFRLSKELFDQLDPFGTSYPILLLKKPKIRPFRDMPRKGPILAIPFQDPSNVGAVIRTSLAMGVRTLLLTESCASPFLPKAVRASGPCILSVELFGRPKLEEIRALGLPIVGLATPPKGVDILSFGFPEDFILLPGLEGPGLPLEMADQLISIPMEEGVESLNVGVATGIALFWWRARGKLRGPLSIPLKAGEGA